MSKIILFCSALLVFTLMHSLPLRAEEPKTPIVKDGVARYVTATLLPEYDHITAGQKLRFAVVQDIAPEWHTYWQNPGDSGESTKIKWSLPEGYMGNDLKFPTPQREPFGPLLNFGYSRRAVFLTEIMAPPVIESDTVTIKASSQWLVCKDICVPEQTEFELQLPVAREGVEPKKINTDVFAEALATQPIRDELTGSFEEGDGTITLTVTAKTLDLKNVNSAEFFPYEWGIILNPNAQEFTPKSNGFSLRMSRDTRALDEIKSLDGVMVLIQKDGTRKGYKISVPLPHAANNNAAVGNDNATADVGDVNNAAAAASENGAVQLTVLTAVFFAVLGGLILNLMPCVFPILSMKALSLVKLSNKEQSHAVIYGLSYTAGVLVTFAGIAGLLIVLQHAGAEIGWGFQLQNPIVVLALTYLLFVIGLNLSGFFEFSSAFGNLGQRYAQKHGYVGSFFTGALATIVATPCTAPFMGTALGFALTQPAIISLVVFVSLGFGLALPYLALCVVPSLRRVLPKPGAWMETFKEFLAFPIFASAGWLLWVYAQQTPNLIALFTALIGAVGIAFSIWFWKKSAQKFLFRVLAIWILVSALGFAFAPSKEHKSEVRSLEGQQVVNGVNESSVSNSNSNSIHGDHVPFSKEKFDSLMAGDDALFVNMTASWCITCKINERMALMDKSVHDAFAQNKVTYIVGDWTNQNPEITEYLASFGRNGVPIYVFYPPRNKATGERPTPKLLPQLLTPTLIKDTLELK